MDAGNKFLDELDHSPVFPWGKYFLHYRILSKKARPSFNVNWRDFFCHTHLYISNHLDHLWNQSITWVEITNCIIQSPRLWTKVERLLVTQIILSTQSKLTTSPLQYPALAKPKITYQWILKPSKLPLLHPLSHSSCTQPTFDLHKKFVQPSDQPKPKPHTTRPLTQIWKRKTILPNPITQKELYPKLSSLKTHPSPIAWKALLLQELLCHKRSQSLASHHSSCTNQTHCPIPLLIHKMHFILDKKHDYPHPLLI